MSAIQTGANHNISNFKELITRVSNIANGYNPSRPELTVDGLKNLLNRAEEVKAQTLNAEVVMKNAQTECSASLDGFDQFITRIGNAITICGAPQNTIDQLNVIIRDLHGRRASAIVTPTAVVDGSSNKAPESNQITRHLSTTESKIENFNKLIAMLLTVSAYKPNEYDLSIDGLKDRYNTIKNADNNYTIASSAFDSAREIRRNVTNTDGTGLVDLASATKLYVKSAFGASSSEYKSISGLLFKRI